MHGPMPCMHGEPMGPMRPMRPRGGPRGAMGGDPAVMRELQALGVHFYPPQMLLRRAGELGLTPDQIGKIRQAVLGAQAKAVDLKARVGKAKVEATRLLAADKVDERAVGAQIDEATKAGAELRKLMLGVMLHVRDLLTPEQIKKLEERRGPKGEAKPPAAGDKQAAAADDDGDAGDDDD
jgi:Spy/CpxP family protein refolding chaperone